MNWFEDGVIISMRATSFKLLKYAPFGTFFSCVIAPGDRDRFQLQVTTLLRDGDIFALCRELYFAVRWFDQAMLFPAPSVESAPSAPPGQVSPC